MVDGQSEQGVSFLHEDDQSASYGPDLHKSSMVGEEIGRGKETVVREFGKDKVIKTPNFDNDEDKESVNFLNRKEVLEWHKKGAIILKKYFGDYVLEEFFGRGYSEGGVEVNYSVQDRVRGRIAADYDVGGWESVLNNRNEMGKTIEEQGKEILVASVKIFLETGIPVDVNPGNIMVEDRTNNLVLFDPGPYGALLHLMTSNDVNISKELLGGIKKYFDHGKKILESRLKYYPELTEERLGISLKDLLKEMEVAAQDPLSYVKKKTKVLT